MSEAPVVDSTMAPAPTPAPTTKETDTPDAAKKTDQNQVFSLKVKPDYILDKRPESLGELPSEQIDESSNNHTNGDSRDNDRGKRGRKKKNKKRPRDARTPNSEKVCLSVLRGGECQYGETCKFSHDLQLYLKTREEDLTSLEDGCPNFKESGYCLFGAMCRFGSCHIIKATGENLRNEAVEAPPPIQNNLPKEVLLQLRKRNYPFKQKRNDKKGDNKEPIASRNNEKEAKTDSTAKPELNTGAEAEGSVDKKDDTPDNSKPEAPVPDKKEGTAAAEHFKSIVDPFRPSLIAANTNSGYNNDNSTPLPSKTKRIIDFSNKVYVAPLTTVGNLPFRRIMKKFGADITCGEMAVAGNLLDGKPGEWALLKRHPEEDVFGVQIASGYPDQFTRVCEVIENHMQVDFIDMNLGCPLDLICNKGAGSALMLREKKLKGILEGVTAAVSCPVTVKMRIGWTNNKPFARELVSSIQSWGIDGIGAVMVHGRSRTQRYSNLADWDYISEVAKGLDLDLPKLPVIGNGDIFSYADHEERVAREGLETTAMLARGALIKPWLPTEIKERRHWDISSTERLEMLKDFVRFGLTHWGSDQQGVDNTRRFLLEWLSFLYRYVPVGLLEVVPQQMNQRPPAVMKGRDDLETLFLSPHSYDWVKISEMLLGKVPDGFRFEPKHKAKGHT